MFEQNSTWLWQCEAFSIVELNLLYLLKSFNHSIRSFG